MKQSLRTRFTLFIRTNQALASIEFAFLLPVLLTLFFGIVEFTRLILIHQKLEKTVSSMADFVTQSERIFTSEMNTYRTVANEIMKPFSFSTGTITFSSVINYTSATGPCAANLTCISWQYTPGSVQARSKIGSVGGRPTMPNNLVVESGQNYIIAEIFYDFNPLLSISGKFVSGLASQTGNNALYRAAIYKPRLNNLSTISTGGAR